MMTGSGTRQRRPIHHFGYAVADMSASINRWVSVHGAGPFFSLATVEFEMVHSFGRPCVFQHVAAFGQCGDTLIELQHIYDCKPFGLRERLVPSELPALNHVGYVSNHPEEDRERLERDGMTEFMYAKIGAVEARFFDARHAIGHAIEIHRSSDFLLDFTSRIKKASQDWDGRDPLRDAAHLEAYT